MKIISCIVWVITCMYYGFYITEIFSLASLGYFLLLPSIILFSINRDQKSKANIPSLLTFIYITIVVSLLSNINPFYKEFYYLTIPFIILISIDKYFFLKTKKNDN